MQSDALNEIEIRKEIDKVKIKKSDPPQQPLDDKLIVLKKLDQLQEEINLIRASLNVGSEMAPSVVITEQPTEQCPMTPMKKNENIVESEKVELLQKPDMKNIFNKIESFLLQ